MKPTTIIIMTLLLIAPALAIDLDPGEFYTFNYTNSTNQNASEEFLCQAINITLACQQLDTTTISLQPGTTETHDTGICKYNATCSTCPAEDTGICVINKQLQPGSKLTINDDACNINIEVDETVECPNIDDKLISTNKEITVRKTSNGTFTLEIEDQPNVPIPSGDLPFTWTAEIELLCPESTEQDIEIINSTENINKLLSICADVSPLLVSDWIAPTLTACRNSAATHVSDIKECTSITDNIREELAQCKADKASQTASIQAMETTKEELREQLNSQQNSLTNRLVMAILGWCLSALLLIVLIMIIIELRRRD